jgi:hypothetical protein
MQEIFQADESGTKWNGGLLRFQEINRADEILAFAFFFSSIRESSDIRLNGRYTARVPGKAVRFRSRECF